MKKFIIKIITTLLLANNLGIPANSAENLFLYRGTFSRIIAIEELKEFSQTGKTNKKIKNILKLSSIKKEELYKILNHEIDVPLNITSKLIYSKIGKVLINRLADIIYPNKLQKNKIKINAIRSAIIQGSSKNNEKISIMIFLENYPNKDIALNINLLSVSLTKLESLSELIKFYSESPLKRLQEGGSNT